MANEEQLEILKQGVEVWNQWREEHPDEKIDLRNTNLREADLHEANLRDALARKMKITSALFRWHIATMKIGDQRKGHVGVVKKF